MTPQMPMMKQLSPLQLTVLRVLWDRGEATVAEVHERVQSTRPLALNTVATLLSRLERISAAEPAAGAGHDRHAAFEIDRHLSGEPPFGSQSGRHAPSNFSRKVIGRISRRLSTMPCLRRPPAKSFWSKTSNFIHYVSIIYCHSSGARM